MPTETLKLEHTGWTPQLFLACLTVWITENWNILKGTSVPDHFTCLLRNLYVGQEITEPDMEQLTGSKL